MSAVAALEWSGLLGNEHSPRLWGTSALAWANRFALGLILANMSRTESGPWRAVRLVGASWIAILVTVATVAPQEAGDWFYSPPLSATTLLCFALASGLLDARLAVADAMSPWLATAGILLNGVTLLGYLYGATPLYGGLSGGVGVFSAATSVLLGTGLVVAAGKNGAPLRVLTGRSITAQLLRALLPLTCLAMLLGELISDWVRGVSGRDLAAQDALQTFFATALITVVVTVLARRVGRRLDAAEQRRDTAEAALSAANESLAEKIQQRTAELQALNDELRLQIMRQREIESALRESESKSNALLTALPDWIFRLAVDGTVLDARAPRENFAESAKALQELQRELTVRVAEHVRQHPQMRSSETFDFTVPLQEATFEARFVRTQQGEVLAVVRDISELARLEREVLEANVREQRRIGEELHDGIGQQLTAVAFMSKILELELSEGNLPQAEQAAEIGRHVSASIGTLRTLARGLFRYELGSGSLLTALEDLANAADNNYRVQCTLDADQSIKLSDRAADLHLYRISQEAITNAVKHGCARKIHIELKREGGQIVFRVQDDGNGAPVAPKSRGVGLRTMEFRTRRLGGRFSIESRAGKGTAITCVLPDSCPAAANDAECQNQLALFH